MILQKKLEKRLLNKEMTIKSVLKNLISSQYKGWRRFREKTKNRYASTAVFMRGQQTYIHAHE